MEKWEGKVAVVTGASVGIGAAICRALGEAGMIVCGMSKRKDKMEVSLVLRSVKIQNFKKGFKSINEANN